jgi:glycosyltransferase involved in cell wall biosynthesis
MQRWSSKQFFRSAVADTRLSDRGEDVMMQLPASGSAVLTEERIAPIPKATAPHEVVCVCGGFGFPRGTGSTPRIIMVGKALQLAGVRFRLLHCGPSPSPVNVEKSGVFEGIPFEYTTSVRRSKNAVVRSMTYARAILVLTARLTRLRRNRQRTSIWLYIMDGPANLYVAWLCRLLGLPVVQELCEWWPGEPRSSRFTKWLHRKWIFKNATGVLVISKEIERRTREAADRLNPGMIIYRVPALVDMDRFPPPVRRRTASSDPVLLWCGSADDWGKDVLFLIRVVAIVRRQGFPVRLVLLGFCSDRARAMITEAVRKQGLHADHVVIGGYVDEQTFAQSLQSAAALVLPLRNDDRSITRLPNKLAEFLAASAPVVTCNVGDLSEFLTDEVSAYLAEPGDEASFAARVISVLTDPAAAERIGAAGREACAAHLDYRLYPEGLARFFHQCATAGEQKHDHKTTSTRRNSSEIPSLS